MKKILYMLLTLFILFSGFLMVCFFNPDITDAVADFLYSRPAGEQPDANQAVSAEAESDEADLDSFFGDNNYPEMESTEKESTGQYPGGEASPGYPPESKAEGMAEDVASGYVSPDQSVVVIPEAVSGRNGYQQVQDEQEQIDENTARQLQSQLDTGYTGDGLEFDALYYPYYAMLNETGKHVYRQIYANGSACYQTFAPVEAVTPTELKNIFSAVYNDHPELFWMETAYAGKFAGDDRCVEIDLRFNRTARNLESARATFEENANRILAEAQILPDDYSREKFVHDVLLERITYNTGAEMHQSAYSALVNGQTVCAGYARAFQYLMQQLGIPCYYCTGYAGESHAWNIVMLDDGFYNVDTTWDDAGGGSYSYFNKTDADYADSHIRQELSVYLPPCDGQRYRNLEPENEAENGSLRSLAETGLTEERVFTDMQGYYENCAAQILQNGRGKYEFYNVIEGEALVSEWYRNYQDNSYRQAYLENVMMEIGATSCEIVLGVEKLQGEQYLIRHELYVQ